MDRKVIWSPPALRELEAIGDYIAQDSVGYSISFVEEILHTASTLSLFPQRGRVVPEFHEQTLREVFVKRYRLIYGISEHTVDIVAIIHMSRDFLNAWDERNSEP